MSFTIRYLNALSAIYENRTQRATRALVKDLSRYGGLHLTCACLGMYPVLGSRVENGNNHTPTTRLAALKTATRVYRRIFPWTWSRVSRIVVVLIALSQGIGTMILWELRTQREADLNIDARNSWAALGSIVSNICSLLLLIIGREWILDPDRFETFATQSSSTVLLRAQIDPEHPHLENLHTNTHPAYIPYSERNPEIVTFNSLGHRIRRSESGLVNCKRSLFVFACECVMAAWSQEIAGRQMKERTPGTQFWPISFVRFMRADVALSIWAMLIGLLGDCGGMFGDLIKLTTGIIVRRKPFEHARLLLLATIFLWVVVDVGGLLCYDLAEVQRILHPIPLLAENEILKKQLWQDPLSESIPVI